MATGDTAPPLAMSSSPPPLLDHSPSNLSSPLSDVEDKDHEPEEMDLIMHSHDLGRRTTAKHNDTRDGDDSDLASDSDDESKLSEMDVNDSEAETERLYDTPRKNNGTRDVLDAVGDVGNRQFVDRRDRAFERSPSKLQQQIQADLDAERAASDNNSLSEGEEEDDDDVSVAFSEPEPEPQSIRDKRLRSPLLAKKPPVTSSPADSAILKATRTDSTDSRKRKRPSVTEQSEVDQPLRKRTGSIGVVPDGEFSADDIAVVDDEGTSTNPQSGNHSGVEDTNGEVEIPSKTKVKPVDSVEHDVVEPIRSERAKRNVGKRRKSKSLEDSGGQPNAEPQKGATETVDGSAAGASAPHAEDGHTEDADEAEAAHKNEEELERKKAAWEELTAIEKQFSNFRERLYQERLQRLNQEEAMLNCENPIHPEYLAMLQPINERKEKRVKAATQELEYRMQMMERRAVAERAQILTQYTQSVRELRQKVLEELGQEWYDIQAERRRFANAIPDYGIHYPETKTQSIRHAVAYNKEVSILSGFAKHVGFPAAPPIHGVSEDQLENDLEAIIRAREPPPPPPPPPPISRPIVNHPPPVFHQEFTAGLPFGRNLGPAGEQFIEQTPWANPNHPSHQIQRQHSQHSQHHSQHEGGSHHVLNAHMGPSSGNRDDLMQMAPSFSPSAGTMLNGGVAAPIPLPTLPTTRVDMTPNPFSVGDKGSLGEEYHAMVKKTMQPLKRESVAQAS
ncbi:Sds3-like-domain-containing protein [Bombardia bombarda]|uniref:Sds3-like-domain-containing protein n=1 Tax=Bombardia bombarda TaxID=252184 RepID=A0AA40BXZ8_9PEZI|nr:Sds3-like-domain-containing protein [Bombardia bombarda]